MRVRRGFTLVELIVAGVITAFILGSVAMGLSQLGRAKNTSKLRFDAHVRADAALSAIRKDIISVTRSDDLFFTRFMLLDDVVRQSGEYFDRDEVMVFNTRMKPLRNIDFNGEGFEYETHYRVSDDDLGPVLWARHDAMPDEYPLGGGMVIPSVEGILSLMIEVYDGQVWYTEWDSDIDGLPVAVRVTVMASGHRGPDDVYSAPRATLRTVIPIDRVLLPNDVVLQQEQEDEDAATEDEAANAEADDAAAGEDDADGDADGGGVGRPRRPREGDGPPGGDGPRRPRGNGNGPRGPGTGNTRN